MTPSPLEETRLLGTARLEPAEPVVAGSVGTWKLIYTVGALGIDEGGTIKIAHRFASDWERPQFDDPAAPAYTTVATNGTAKLAFRYDPKGHIRPYMKAIVIDVSGDALKPGEEVVVTYGDRTGGSPGMRAQTFQESAHEFKVFVDPTNACVARPLPDTPTVRVVAGPAAKAVCLLPMRCVVGGWNALFVRGEDRWGNPAPTPAGRVRWEGGGDAEIDGGRFRLRAPGTGWAVFETEAGSYCSNPVTASERAPEFGRFWADLHAQTGTTIGTGTDEEYFTFGRDAARLDVISHQANDFQVTDALWASLNETTRRFHEDGKYVVLPGYEWSANTPCGGDHNVFYLEEGLPILRSSHWQTPGADRTPFTPAHPLETFFEKMREAVPAEKVVVASHVGGRYADLRRRIDDALAPLVEVVSCWGVFEWMLWDSFEHGHKVGVMANSDGHKGRPGSEGPGAGEFGIANGLTCILARSLTRPAVLEALRERRCYGTTGTRIDLGFTVNGRPMGSVIAAPGAYRVEAHVSGTAPLEELALYAGRERLHVVRPGEFASAAGSRRVRIRWGGAASRGRSRRMVWEGALSVSGNRIVKIVATGFDSPVDGILSQTEHEVRFRSGTTGDADFFDIELEHAACGTLELRTSRGSCEASLAAWGDEPVRRACDGLDAFLSLARYPAEVVARSARFDLDLPAQTVAGRPLFVRALQIDGHLAWASPVYTAG